MDPLSDILDTFRLNVEIVHNAQYCGDWAIDTSGTGSVSFHLVTHGKCFARSDCMDEVVELEKGDFIIFPHDSAHVLEAQSNCQVALNSATPSDYDEGFEVDSVGLLCGYFQFANPASNPLLSVLPSVMIKCATSNAKREPSLSLLELISNEALERASGNQAAINRLTESLFIMLVREFIVESGATQGIAAALHDPRIRKALSAMHLEFERSWKVEELASLAAMSRSSFSETFKSLLSESPLAYLAKLRMQKAWVWLAEDGDSVFAVAQRTGYESEASFSKAFKKVVGVSPGSLRKK
ncbi:MAG: AraC family transcriptional regulator [Pseudomonadales bacterium]